jgi:hypothetical protein
MMKQTSSRKACPKKDSTDKQQLKMILSIKASGDGTHKIPLLLKD